MNTQKYTETKNTSGKYYILLNNIIRVTKWVYNLFIDMSNTLRILSLDFFFYWEIYNNGISEFFKSKDN